MGSLAGAAHRLKHNAGALKQFSASTETKRCRGRPKRTVDAVITSKSPECESMAHRSFVEGVRVLGISKPEVSEKLP
jgi:hypothetical protein